MDRSERLHQIDRLLSARRAVPVRVLLDELQISLATFKRDLAYLRDRLAAPIVWDRERRGYRYEGEARAALPGLWFNASEIYALLTMQQLLAELQPGLLAPHVAPLMARLSALLEAAKVPPEQVANRVRILRAAARRLTPEAFSPVAEALFSRRRLAFDYWHRERDEVASRTVSPQRLTHYRDHWYLEAWCHTRQDLRRFALDAIRSARPLPEPAQEMAGDALDARFDGGYGIFSGTPTATAVLLFEATRARWVASETWHPAQQGEWLPDGRYRLSVPYADDRELMMDILKFGPDVTVEAPPALRERVAAQLAAALARYETTRSPDAA